ncbi:MAG: hypothetical protein MK085_04165 [Phycisphaerales bacterium]|nr:hypothetical protein [Phycisphaerales bacterium]
MRGGRGLLLVTGAVILVVALPPFIGMALELVRGFGGVTVDPAELGFRGPEVAGTTLLWAGLAGLAATLIGWGPGRRLALRPDSRLAWATLVALALPAALVFDAWWLQASPQSSLGRWAAEHGQVPLLRGGILALALVGWGWPIAAWTLAARGVRGGDGILARMDGVNWWRRVGLAWRADRASLLLGWVLCTAFLAGNTVCFDLAQVHTWGFELRTLDARGANAATVFLAGAPALGVAAIAAVFVVRLLGMPRGRSSRSRLQGGGTGAWLVALCATGLPLVLLLYRGLAALDLEMLRVVHGPAIVNTVMLGLGCGILAAVIAVGFSVAKILGGTWTLLGSVVAGALAILAIAPATLVAVGMEAAFNVPGLEVVYRSFMVLFLAVSARIGIVAAIVGLVAASGMSQRLLSLDAPGTMRDFLRAARPVLLRSALAAGVLGATLAMGEIPLVARVQPPGAPLVGTALLNAMHYQYVDSVIPAILGLVLVAAMAAAIVRFTLLRRIGGGLAALACAILVVGCGPPTDVQDPVPVQASTVFGSAGINPGRFDYPRAIALDASGEQVYVIDKTARVQRFDLEGSFLGGWVMPQWENGKPTGVAVASDGRVYVADTHYHRIAVFNQEGEELLAFGKYGEGAGEFIYPTDVAFGPNGMLFVSEYGGNDRVQVFDGEGKYLYAFGSMGPDLDQFSRPQALAWDDAAGELFIADAINHRIVVTDAGGEVQRVLGGAGREPGRLSYPYDLALPGDGTVMVVEFGNNRVQRLDVNDGSCRGIWGGTGREAGRLRYPWGIDAKAGVLAVLDSGNSRVLLGDTP